MIYSYKYVIHLVNYNRLLFHFYTKSLDNLTEHIMDYIFSGVLFLHKLIHYLTLCNSNQFSFKM